MTLSFPLDAASVEKFRAQFGGEVSPLRMKAMTSTAKCGTR